MSEVGAAIGEDMQVRDTASEDIRRTRNKCRTLEGRLRALLKGASGEVSEQVERKSALRQILSCTGELSAAACEILFFIPSLGQSHPARASPGSVLLAKLYVDCANDCYPYLLAVMTAAHVSNNSRGAAGQHWPQQQEWPQQRRPAVD